MAKLSDAKIQLTDKRSHFAAAPKARFLKGRRVFIALGAAIALALGSPLAAQAAEQNYQLGELLVGTWKWSGHHTMNGAKAWGYAYAGQILKLQNDGFALQTGIDNIWVSHSSTFTVSKCGWTGMPAGTKATTTCNYTY